MHASVSRNIEIPCYKRTIFLHDYVVSPFLILIMSPAFVQKCILGEDSENLRIWTATPPSPGALSGHVYVFGR